jgi:hypothetical protein
MPTLDELIADSKLADDLELAMGDTKIKLGDVRKWRSAQTDDIAKRAKAVDVEREKVNKLAEDALKLWNQMKDAPPPKTAEPKHDDDDMAWAEDPWLAKVGKAMQKISKQLADQQAKYDKALEDHKAALAQGFNYVVTRDYEQRWNGLPNKPADKSWKDYLKVAQDNKINDQWGLPDPIKAYEESTKEDRLAALKLAEYNRGIEEGKKAAAATQVPRPGTASAIPTRPKGEKVYSEVNDLLDDAFGDQDIQKLMTGGGAVQ